jgi:hypothetical protein
VNHQEGSKELPCINNVDVCILNQYSELIRAMMAGEKSETS